MNEITESLKMKVPDLITELRTGQWMKARVLSKKLGISERELRTLIRYIRLNVTWQISSGDGGYFWQTDTVEAINQMKRIKEHSLSQLELVKAAEKMIAEEQGKLNVRSVA